MPADCCRVEEDGSTAERGNPCALGIPLIPANERAYSAVSGVEVQKSGVAGRKVELFVVKRIVRNVHLTIDSEQRSVGVEHSRGVVIEPWGAFFKKGSHYGYLRFFCDLAQRFRRWPRYRFSEVEECGVFFAAEILGPK